MKIDRVVKFLSYAIIAGLILILLSCKTTSVNQLVGVSVTLKSLCEKPTQYLDKEIEIQGTFHGWSGSDCKFVDNYAHQLTRSDWTFCDTEAICIYVTGGKPDFLDPLRDEDIGKKIRLKAKFKQAKDKKFYLQYISAIEAAENN